MYIVYIVKIFEITLHFSEKMTKKKNKKLESAIMLLKIFEVSLHFFKKNDYEKKIKNKKYSLGISNFLSIWRI